MIMITGDHGKCWDWSISMTINHLHSIIFQFYNIFHTNVESWMFVTLFTTHHRIFNRVGNAVYNLSKQVSNDFSDWLLTYFKLLGNLVVILDKSSLPDGTTRINLLRKESTVGLFDSIISEDNKFQESTTRCDKNCFCNLYISSCRRLEYLVYDHVTFCMVKRTNFADPFCICY